MESGDAAESSMDLIAHWLKDEQGLQIELHQAMLAMGQQLHETPEAIEWPLSQWQSWLEQNSFDLQLLHQALQQLFANAGEAEPYAAICQELSQQPDDGPGIEALLACAEHHSEQLAPQLLEELEAEAKATEALFNTSGGSSSSHHKLAQNMSNHRTAWSAGGGTAGAVVLTIGAFWYKRTRNAKQELNDLINEAKHFGLQDHPDYTAAEKATKSWLPSNIRAAAKKLDTTNKLTKTIKRAKSLNLDLENHDAFKNAEQAMKASDHRHIQEAAQELESVITKKSALKTHPKYTKPIDLADQNSRKENTIKLTPGIEQFEQQRAQRLLNLSDHEIERITDLVFVKHEQAYLDAQKTFVNKYKWTPENPNDGKQLLKGLKTGKYLRTPAYYSFRIQQLKDELSQKNLTEKYEELIKLDSHEPIIDQFIKNVETALNTSRRPGGLEERFNQLVDDMYDYQEAIDYYSQINKYTLELSLAEDSGKKAEFESDLYRYMKDDNTFHHRITLLRKQTEPKRDQYLRKKDMLAKWQKEDKRFKLSPENANDSSAKLKFNQYHGYRFYNSYDPDFRKYKNVNWKDIEARGQEELEKNEYNQLERLNIDNRQMQYKPEWGTRQELTKIDPPAMTSDQMKAYRKAHKGINEEVNLADSNFLKSEKFKRLLKSFLNDSKFDLSFMYNKSTANLESKKAKVLELERQLKDYIESKPETIDDRLITEERKAYEKTLSRIKGELKYALADLKSAEVSAETMEKKLT